MRGVRALSVSVLGVCVLAGCGGTKGWHPIAREQNASRTVVCGAARSPDRSEVRWICVDRGQHECLPEMPATLNPTLLQRELILTFDGNASCREAQKALRKAGYIR